jgi:hypothetical protein
MMFYYQLNVALFMIHSFSRYLFSLIIPLIPSVMTLFLTSLKVALFKTGPLIPKNQIFFYMLILIIVRNLA